MADEEPSWPDYRKRLLEKSQAAVKTREEWQRRWFLSLTFGNGAGIAAVASAAFNIASAIGADHQKRELFYALVPAAWLFSLGLIGGGLLPFLWAKKVEKIPTLTNMRDIEIDNGPQMVGDPEDPQVSCDIIADAEKHEKFWSKCFDASALISTGAFLISLFWLLFCATAWAIRSTN